MKCLDVTWVDRYCRYCTFGMAMPGRTYAAGGQKYKYGFNGKESSIDDGLDGYDFGERFYDERLGRWMSTDPHEKMYPGISPYNFAYNSPIIFNDPNGADGRLTINQATHEITLVTVVHLYGPDANADLANTLNTNYSIISPSSRVFIDDNNQEWTVTIKITYDAINHAVLDEMTNGMNANGTNAVAVVDDIDKSRLKNFLEGDNIMHVDTKIPIVLINGISPAGLTSGKGNSGARIGYGASDKTYIHEAFHQLGYDERYFGAYTHEDFENDVMGGGASNVRDLEIHPQHYIALVNVGARGKSYNNIVLKKKSLDNTKSGNTEAGRANSSRSRERERNNDKNKNRGTGNKKYLNNKFFKKRISKSGKKPANKQAPSAKKPKK